MMMMVMVTTTMMMVIHGARHKAHERDLEAHGYTTFQQAPSTRLTREISRLAAINLPEGARHKADSKGLEARGY
eukprot:5326331-Pyramimonas_sp.AAC.1